MKSKIIFLVPMLALLSGCAVGPLVSHETARSNGQGKNEFVGGYGVAGYILKWNYGVGENFDIGVHWESLSIGLRAKYSFINNQSEGWSLAGALGLGESIGGNHYYADLMASYLAYKWEPYGTLRFVHVKTDPLDFRDEDTQGLDFTVDSATYDYGQFILGTRYWFTEHWLLSLEASTLFSMSSRLKIGSGVIAGAAFGYRF